MAMSYFYGKPIYDKMSSQEKNKWKKKYMKKWTRGEKFGYVAW